MIRFAENLNKMIAAGLGGAMEAPSTEVAVGYRVRYMDASGPVANFNTNIAAPIRSLRVNMRPIQEGSGDPSPDNVRPITGRESVTVWREASYDPSADPALTIALGQTVYGGTLDVTAGKLTVDRAIVDLGTLTWLYDQITFPSWAFFYTSDLGNVRKIGWDNLVCSNYPLTSSMYARYEDFVMNGTGYRGTRSVNIRDSRYTDVASFKEAMSGVQLVYELATPLEITLDPATLSTLKGTNNVWSDGGDVTLEYPYYEETEGY